MSWLSKGASDEVGGRLRQYRRREAIILWIGAGLGAIVALFAAIEFTREADIPRGIVPVVPVAVILAGGCLALSRIQFEWAAELLERGLKNGELGESAKLPQEHMNWPVFAECLYRLEGLLAVVAAVWIIVLSIWSAVVGPTVGSAVVG